MAASVNLNIRLFAPIQSRYAPHFLIDECSYTFPINIKCSVRIYFRIRRGDATTRPFFRFLQLVSTTSSLMPRYIHLLYYAIGAPRRYSTRGGTAHTLRYTLFAKCVSFVAQCRQLYATTRIYSHLIHNIARASAHSLTTFR